MRRNDNFLQRQTSKYIDHIAVAIVPKDLLYIRSPLYV